MQQRATGINVSSWLIYSVACALVVIGTKCWMIAGYGSPTPFWDQWDAEAAGLYPNFLSGTLSFSDLIAPHNEHRILMTRLWSLLLLELGGYWDPILQMVANVLLLGLFVALLVIIFRPILDRRSWIGLSLFVTAIFAVPFAWENTLSGFHSQWYFMLLFSICGLAAIVGAAAFTLRWWLAMLLMVASYFSMSGGLLSAAAAFAVCLVQVVVRRRTGLAELLALAILAALTVAMLRDMPMTAELPQFMAHSTQQFLRAVLAITAWPVARNPISALILCAILIHAPAWLTSLAVVSKRLPLTDHRWLLVALTGWLAMQTIAVAYGRAMNPLSARYLDVYAIALLLNFACLLRYLAEARASGRRRQMALAATALWLLLLIPGAGGTLYKHSIPEMVHRGAVGRTETENLRAYLDTGNIGVLENKAGLDIPYPDATRLAMIVSQPVIRGLLPPALVGEASAARARQRGLAQFTGRPIEALKDFALRWGVLLIPIGLALFLAGLMMQLRRERKTAAS
jgi:hypothetical protein